MLFDSIISENQPIGTVIGTLTTIDPDDLARDSTYIYMVNNDTFRIEKDTLKINRELDFEEKDVYTIQITTNDGKGGIFTKSFGIKVEDIYNPQNEMYPHLNRNVPENGILASLSIW